MRKFSKNHNIYSILLDISPYLCHISAIKFLSGGDMGYKQIEQNMTFAEVSLISSMEHNRSLKRLGKINQLINWSKVDEILMSHYTVFSSSPRRGLSSMRVWPWTPAWCNPPAIPSATRRSKSNGRRERPRRKVGQERESY
jgi:hypothetical protein